VAGNDPLAFGDGHRMPASDGPDLPVANCVLCGWPMDGTVNILEVRIGTAVYRACADECLPGGADRRQRYLADAKTTRRHRGSTCTT